MRDIYKEEKALLEQTRDYLLGREDDSAPAEIVARAQRIQALLDRIRPWSRLKISAYAKRIGIGIGIYLILMLPIALYFGREYRQDAGLVNYTEGVGERVETQYVPITNVQVSPNSFFRHTARYEAVTVENPAPITDLGSGGMAVAILGGQESGTVTALWTALREGKRVLLRRTFNEKLNDNEDVIPVIEDVDLASAAALQREDGSYLIAGAHASPAPTVFLQLYSPEWKPIGTRVSVPASAVNEQLGGIQLAEWGTRMVIVTTTVPPPGSSVLARKEPILRVFESDFSLAFESALQVGSINVDLFAGFVAGSEPNRFYILTSGRPVFDESKGERGNELYMLQFTSTGSPVEYFKLTNNGRPHDFFPTSSFHDKESGFYYVANHRTTFSGFDRPDYPETYPKNTGKAYVHLLEKNLDMLGTVTMVEEETKDTYTEAPTRMRIYKEARKIYAVYDILRRDQEGVVTRSVKVTRVDVNL